ncbi:hypothetical protein [Sediminimonas sp.]|uniref:hypothetical protein n=1 Tax=Sediminimonas sp. TaxID=2823379 RepID=UPI0025E3B192|nr:hypothetical protein [Sediminimonas sp.]
MMRAAAQIGKPDRRRGARTGSAGTRPDRECAPCESICARIVHGACPDAVPDVPARHHRVFSVVFSGGGWGWFGCLFVFLRLTWPGYNDWVGIVFGGHFSGSMAVFLR